MKNRRTAAVVLSFVFSVLATALFLCVMLWLFGPGQIVAAHLFLNLCTAGVMGAVWWFSLLGLCALAARQQPASLRCTLRPAVTIPISCFMAAAGISSVLIVHHGCVCLEQRIEASRANFTCVQVRQIEKACAILLENAAKSGFHELLVSPAAGVQELPPLNTIVPELLRRGCNADLPLDPDVRTRLAATYSEYFDSAVETRRWWRSRFSRSVPDDGLVDGWERPFEYAEPSPPDWIPTVRSLGPDGLPSADDIRRDFLPEMDQDCVAFEFYDAAPVNRTPFARLYFFVTGQKWLSASENILHSE